MRPDHDNMWKVTVTGYYSGVKLDVRYFDTHREAINFAWDVEADHRLVCTLREV